MNNSGKRILSFLLLAFLVFHFLCLINYASPLKSSNRCFNVITTMYGYPYFHQQWTVFVPTPVKKFELMIRNGSGNKWQRWTNIVNHLLKRRKYNLPLGRETEVLLITNSINYLSYDLGETNRVFNKKPDLQSFKVLEHAANYYFRNFRCWKAGKEYELLLITHSPGKRTAYYFKNLSLL